MTTTQEVRTGGPAAGLRGDAAFPRADPASAGGYLTLETAVHDHLGSPV